MPIYEYGCQGCGKVFEYMQRMSDDPKTECEDCGGALERLISRSAFHLKGGGWYKDLYSSTKKDSGGATDAASDKGASAAKADSGSSDAKPSASESKPAKSSASSGD